TLSEPDVYGVMPDLSDRPWIDIVLEDQGLRANGLVSPAKGQIRLLTGMPDTRRFIQTRDYWTEILRHEVTHYAHLRMLRPPVETLAWLFGPVFPTMTSPLFLTEGLAVWAESQDGYGRLHDGYTHAVVAAQLQAGRIPKPAALRYP